MNERTEIKKVIENSIKNKDFKNALSLCKKIQTINRKRFLLFNISML